MTTCRERTAQALPLQIMRCIHSSRSDWTARVAISRIYIYAIEMIGAFLSAPGTFWVPNYQSGSHAPRERVTVGGSVPRAWCVRFRLRVTTPEFAFGTEGGSNITDTRFDRQRGHINRLAQRSVRAVAGKIV